MNVAVKVSNIKLCTTSHNNVVCFYHSRTCTVDEARSGLGVILVFLYCWVESGQVGIALFSARVSS